MDDDKINIIFGRLNSLDKILRVVQTDPTGGITTGGNAVTKDWLVGEIHSVPSNRDAKSAPLSDDFAQKIARRSESNRLREIERRQRDFEARLERLEKMML